MVTERRLKFIETAYVSNKTFQVFNNKDELIGLVRKERVGQYLHWCFVVPKYLFDNIYTEYYQYSSGCQDEIREFCKNPDKYKEKYAEYVLGVIVK